jgi:hypothetical protein
MKKRTIKKIVIISLSSLLFLFAVLCIHIYVMMKPRPASEKTIAMARIDFKQDINQADADKITSWLYSQKGVQHVLCNQQTKIAIISFYPVKVNADKLTENLASSLNLKAVRFMPSQADMMKGCPAIASSSFSYKVYTFMNRVF